MPKIAVAGFQHETNVFAPHGADYAAFARRDEWPPLCAGAAMLDEVVGVNLPAGGALRRLKQLGYEVAPLLWCAATPSAHVREEAFERIAAQLIEALRAALPVDGVLLDLHGAMVCSHIADADGELLRRVREAVGAAMPLAVSLDLHANLSERMAAQAGALEIYRTYPHLDMAETGARAADRLDFLVRHRLARFPSVALRRPEFLIPLNWGCTLTEPAGSLYASLPARAQGNAGVSLACGFPHSDVEEAGPAVVAYGLDARAADAAADDLLAELNRREHEFRGRVYGVADGVAEALRLADGGDEAGDGDDGNGPGPGPAPGPVIIADTQDNPGGGGPGDTTEILRALIDGVDGVNRGGDRPAGVLVGVISDPQAAAQAHAAGAGARIDLALGGKSGFPGSRPLRARFRVRRLSDGRFDATGPMLAGASLDLGPMALLETGGGPGAGVQVAVASKPAQTMDQAMFRHLGAEPRDARIIALKSSVHFRNDFQDMAAAILIVAAPGPVAADLTDLPFQTPRLQRMAARL